MNGSKPARWTPGDCNAYPLPGAGLSSPEHRAEVPEPSVS